MHLLRWFPDAPDRVLETVAFYCVWLFLWDDAIDGADLGGDVLVAEEYCRQSVEFVGHSLGLNEPGDVAPKAPTKICESFAEVGRRIAECCGVGEGREVFRHLREYMEGCVTEYKWRVSRKVPSVEQFYSWRLRTSSVDVMLDLCRLVAPLARNQVELNTNRNRILNGISLPGDILESNELAVMGLSVNKLLIL